MKILMWNPTFVLGGGMNLLVNIVSELAKHPRVESVSVALNKDYRDFKNCRWEGKVKVKFISVTDNINEFLEGQDVVYLTWPHGITPPQINTPMVCIYQDTILLDAYGAHSTASFLRAMENEVIASLEKFSRVIVTSQYTGKRLVELMGPAFSDRIEVLPHIASRNDETKTSLRSEQYEQIEKIISNRQFLFYPANVSEHKNHINLFHALSKRTRRDVQLALCGYRTDLIGKPELDESSYVNRLNKVIRDRNLQPNIDYFSLGYVDDAEVECLWNHCLGLVMPTRAEGMGLPIHDAIERGVPVITSDIEVLREHFADRSDAIFWVDPECPQSIADAWDALCNQNEQLRHLAKSNRSSAKNWSDIVDETVKILERAIELPVEPSDKKEEPRTFQSVIRRLTRNWGV